MSYLFILLLLVLSVSCKNPYVIDAKGIEVEPTSNDYHISYDDSETDEYLEKPMVHEVDVDGIDTTNPETNDKPWLDWPDSTDRALFCSPAAATADEETVDGESDDQRHDFESP